MAADTERVKVAHRPLDEYPGFCRTCLVRMPCDVLVYEDEIDRLRARLASLTAACISAKDVGPSGGGWVDWECVLCRASDGPIALGTAPTITHDDECLLVGADAAPGGQG
jgi:hypothetical protein